MVTQEIKKIKSGKRELRNFGITMAVALAIIGSILLWAQNDYFKLLYIIAAAFLALGILLPPVLKPIHVFWMTLSILMGWVMTRVVLVVLFYLVFTPVGLVARLVGKKFLPTRFDKNATSYWIPREKVASETVDYEKQF